VQLRVGRVVQWEVELGDCDLHGGRAECDRADVQRPVELLHDITWVSIKVVMTPEGDQLHRQTVEDLIDLRRQLIADALPARELSKLNTLLNRILSHIERDHTPDPPIRPPAKSS